MFYELLDKIDAMPDAQFFCLMLVVVSFAWLTEASIKKGK